MRSFITSIVLVFLAFGINAQATYIALTGNNNGSGNHNLFGNCLTAGQNAYIDWETYVDGGSCSGISSSVSGQGSKSRIILRTSSPNSDPTSVIASNPIYIDGIFNGDSGNNDKYYLNLAPYITSPGYYSVEIQVTCMDGTYDADARTSWTYAYPTPYWHASDPLNVVGGSDIQLVNNFNGINGASFLGYFTVGDVAMYRSMVVFEGTYYDLLRFTPGNPPPPTSLTGLHGIPTGGICANGSVPPTLTMGAETNIFHRSYGGFSANVPDCRTFYRVYKDGTAPPAFSSFNVPWRDDCPGNYNAWTGTISTFPSGGSCYSGLTQGTNNSNLADCIQSKRYQTYPAPGSTNILPTSFSPSDAGLWNIDYYNQCTLTDCAGTNTTQTDPTTAPSTYYRATFDVSVPPVGTTICSATLLPLNLLKFEGYKRDNSGNIIIKTANEQDIESIVLERSSSDFSWVAVKTFTPQNKITNSYTYIDENLIKGVNYYRLKITEKSGLETYSKIISIVQNLKNDIRIYPNPVGNGPLQIKNEGFENKVWIKIVSDNGTVNFNQAYDLKFGTHVISPEKLQNISGMMTVLIYDAGSGKLLMSERIVK